MKINRIILILIVTLTFSFAQKNTTIMISFDGFRWDFPDRGLTPNLQQLADRGVKAKSLQPCFPSKTFPNHYSIVTGMYPENHGILFNDIQDDFSGKRYRLSDRDEVQDGKWYQGEAIWETAERQGVITASHFWPGSELTLDYRRPTYWLEYDHDKDYTQRVIDVLKWIDLPESSKPEFITLYFDATDSYGHKYGPDSEENNQAIASLDSMVEILVSGLKDRDIYEQTNIIVLSDHGMTNISEERIVNSDELLSDFEYEYSNEGPVMTIKPDPSKFLEVLNILKQKENHFKVYTKDNIPEHYHFGNHPFIYPIIMIADMGWSIMTDRSIKKWKGKYSKGNHGYDNYHTDMHGIFIAAGPSFKSNYKCGTINNIDIYPLLCRILNIYPRQNIDGKLEEISFILK